MRVVFFGGSFGVTSDISGSILLGKVLTSRSGSWSCSVKDFPKKTRCEALWESMKARPPVAAVSRRCCSWCQDLVIKTLIAVEEPLKVPVGRRVPALQMGLKSVRASGAELWALRTATSHRQRCSAVASAAGWRLVNSRPCRCQGQISRIRDNWK